MAALIGRDRSIIPALDFVSIGKFETILQETTEFSEVGAYKIGAVLALTHGIPKLTSLARKITTKPLIYDHQKAGTDIPDTGKPFMKMLKDSGIDSVIIFPLSGPVTEAAWIEAAIECNLSLICGGHMTHKSFSKSEGGYIGEESIEKIYDIASELGILDFVVPGNKPEVITKIRQQIENKGLNPSFYSPGFITQGGEISAATQAAGKKWHAIVGRAIYESQNIKESVKGLISQL